MPNLLLDGQAWLREQRALWLSELVVYYAAGSPMADVPATRGSTTSEVEVGDIIVETKSVDWLIEVANLPGVTPKRGDLIFADGKYFEVLALGGESHYRWHGSDQKTFRIHSRQVDELSQVTTQDMYYPHLLDMYGPHFTGGP